MELTIFTPTYNRCELLHTLYQSLLRQTYKDFEWLVIDDGSEDDTEGTVRMWAEADNGFQIRYYKQSHGGKHRAMNDAFDLAEGKWFFTVDSDDMLIENAVANILKWIESVEGNDKIAGVAGLKASMNGAVWGGDPHINDNYIDASNFERDKYGLSGDKAEVYRTDILRQNRFPEFSNEYFATEDIAYQEIAGKGYKIRWYNTVIYLCEYLEDGLTNTGANSIEGHLKNYKGFCYWVRRGIELKPIRQKYGVVREFMKTKKAMGKNLKEAAADLNMSAMGYILLLAYILPIGFALKRLKKAAHP